MYHCYAIIMFPYHKKPHILFWNVWYMVPWMTRIPFELGHMMTPSNGNIFRVAGHWCGEFTGHRWIPRTKASARSFDVSLICARINAWLNTREAGDLGRHHAHYYVTVMNRSYSRGDHCKHNVISYLTRNEQQKQHVYFSISIQKKTCFSG